MAKKESLNEDDIIDLTDLIESGNQGDKRVAQAYAKAAAAEERVTEDFEAVLAQSGGSGRPVDPDEALDMSGMGSIDNLLDSLDIPPQPSPGKKKAPAGDDLDDALDDLLGNTGSSRAKSEDDDLQIGAPPGKKAASADLDDLLGDLEPDKGEKDPLDDLLDIPAQPKPAAAKKAADDLDDLLDIPTQPKAAAAKKATDDLDDLLGDLDAEPAPKAPVPKAPAPQTPEMSELDADLDDILSSFDEPVPEPAQTEPEPEEPIQAEAPRAVEPEHAQLNPDEPEIAEAAAPEAPEPADEQGFLDLGAESLKAAAPEPEAEEAGSPEPDFMLDEPVPQNPAEAAPKPALEAPEPPAASLPAQVPAITPETLVGICRSFTGQDGQTQQALQGFSRELGEQSAHVEDLGEQMAQLGKRMLGCESKLAAARARIASLEKAMESTAALEDLLRQGSPLHSGFMALISAAVANALQGFTLPEKDPELDGKVRQLEETVARQAERISQLEDGLADGLKDDAAKDAETAKLVAAVDNMDIRMKSLEQQIAGFSGEAQIEKAAAAAVARILHEEISRLAQS